MCTQICFQQNKSINEEESTAALKSISLTHVNLLHLQMLLPVKRDCGWQTTSRQQMGRKETPNSQVSRCTAPSLRSTACFENVLTRQKEGVYSGHNEDSRAGRSGATEEEKRSIRQLLSREGSFVSLLHPWKQICATPAWVARNAEPCCFSTFQ